MEDLYYKPEYAKLYEKVENGKAVRWRYEGEKGSVLHQFILREIPHLVNGETWYDIVTPYGYGGPVIETLQDGCTKEQLVSAFEQAFAQYCKEYKIVSEFVRFHPMLNNAVDFQRMYSAQCIRHTLGTDLTISDDPIATEFSRSCRKHIRQALNKGVSWRVTEKPENIDKFKGIYYSTMDRNHAQEYYYFDDTYFHQCLETLRENIIFVEAIYEEKTIAAGLYFVCDGIIHIHLSGTLSEYLYLSPAYVLRYAIAQWGTEHGCRLIHHGGGRSNSPEDTLYSFKKQFAKNTEFDFYVGKKVWNHEMYEALCVQTGNTSQTEFFPAYRQ